MAELFHVSFSELVGAEDQAEEVERKAEEQDVQDGAQNAEEDRELRQQVDVRAGRARFP